MREYVARHDKITGRIAADGITFTVVADEGRTGEVLALWRSLTADDRVADADIKDVPWKGVTDRWRIEVTAVDATGALAVFKDMYAKGDRHRPLSGAIVLTVRGGLFVETAFNDVYPAEAIVAYEAVLAQYPVVSATPRRDAVSGSGSAVSIVVAEGVDRGWRACGANDRHTQRPGRANVPVVRGGHRIRRARTTSLFAFSPMRPGGRHGQGHPGSDPRRAILPAQMTGERHEFTLHQSHRSPVLQAIGNPPENRKAVLNRCLITTNRDTKCDTRGVTRGLRAQRRWAH
ncbi:hypothetical protein [Streptomyces niveus]|uniref:hypothetical protein n=1 Tax=Streptomyces niveus TaxID=193462 RepID=UPI001331442F|nr:hypothetical protein [Streptomyces niveus]